jgi:hypothetical protein
MKFEVFAHRAGAQRRDYQGLSSAESNVGGHQGTARRSLEVRQ